MSSLSSSRSLSTSTSSNGEEEKKSDTLVLTTDEREKYNHCETPLKLRRWHPIVVYVPMPRRRTINGKRRLRAPRFFYCPTPADVQRLDQDLLSIIRDGEDDHGCCTSIKYAWTRTTDINEKK